ncbi:hypothetical protein ASG19_17805 [Rhizobium sp. Leaf306]|uniref:hypothetical protein n=1 Tax=Rhizobium sp. Leaf306 TaxID=1736330 RepID=UPI000715DD13|nr:hypothetical protein [Rhizobium sp. Leaf306]KQQ35542.1 hypothetical protein ASG19_17805 [Rhizobium sp. Leaf306]
MRLYAILVLLILPLLTSSARAEQFKNVYMSFELPANWSCVLEETEWVCGDKDQIDKRSAIIILTAKEVGPMDRLDLYEDHISVPVQLVDKDGNSIGRSSRVEFARQEEINGVTWIHGRQFESEVPDYYTDYFATVDSKIAVLVTFSAREDGFDSAYAQFFPSMSTISVTQPK